MTPEDLLSSLDRPLPLDYDAEQSVISCILQNPRLCDELPSIELFYHPVSRMVMTGIVAVIASKLPLDQITLTRALREHGTLDKCGGPFYLSSLVMGGESCAVPSHYPHYLSLISEKFRLRKMILALAEGISQLQAFKASDGVSAASVLDGCQKLVCEAANDDGSEDLPFRSIGEILTSVVDGIEERSANPGKIPGISTGFAGLDKYLGGMEGGRLTIIAGESSDGKSCLARQFVESACIQDHAGVMYTYEMRDDEEGGRLICSQSKVNSNALKYGNLTRGEQMAVASQVAKISRWPITIIDAAGKTIEQICRDIARRSKKLKQGQKLVASIDYEIGRAHV